MKSEPLNLPDNARYNLSETARMLEISRGKLYADIKRGIIRAVPRRDNGRLQLIGRDINRYQKG